MYKWWNLLSFVVLLNAFFFFVVVAADWRFYLTERDFVKPETIFLYTSFMMIRCVHNALYSVIHRIYTECMHICKWFSQGVCRCVEFTLFVVVVVFKKYTECDHQRFSVLRCLCDSSLISLWCEKLFWIVCSSIIQFCKTIFRFF